MAFERIAGLTVKQSAFLVEYAKTENLSQACRVAGINRSTGYKYLENEDFQAALEQAKQNHGCVVISGSLYLSSAFLEQDSIQL